MAQPTANPKLGKHAINMLKFAMRHNGWHSYANDRTTKRAAQTLQQLGFIEINEHQEFRLIQKPK